jgi:predicted kinase
MRKWMRDRLRRKKEPEKSAAETPPAPLQPAFYDIEPKAETSQVEEPPAPSEPPRPVQEAPATQPKPAAQQPIGDARKRRRRRSRGRGGRRAGTQVPQTGTAPSPSVPVTSARDAGISLDTHALPVAVPEPSPRPSRGTVVLAIGLPGSGKSAWFKRHHITPLSSDLLRSLLFDDPTEQRFQDLVFANLRSMLKARLIARRPMNYVDATNLTSHDRHGWIKLAKDYGYDVQAVFFDVPVQVCLARNQKRERVVPEDVMRRMAAKLKPPTFAEGFSKITVVRVKHKEEA